MSYAWGMTMTADEILEHVRALPYRERLKLVERVVHEVAESVDAGGTSDEAEMDQELERRIERTVAGGRTVPAEDVINKLRARG